MTVGRSEFGDGVDGKGGYHSGKVLDPGSWGHRFEFPGLI